MFSIARTLTDTIVISHINNGIEALLSMAGYNVVHVPLTSCGTLAPTHDAIARTAIQYPNIKTIIINTIRPESVDIVELNKYIPADITVIVAVSEIDKVVYSSEGLPLNSYFKDDVSVSKYKEL